MAQKPTFLQELLTKRSQYQRALSGIDAIIEIEGAKEPQVQEEESSSRLEKHGFNSIKVFNDSTIHKAIVPQKTLYALQQLGEGDAHEVAARITKLIPSYSKDKAFKDARNFLSKYFRAGIIEAELIGNKNRYRVPGFVKQPVDDFEEINEHFELPPTTNLSPDGDLPW